MADEPRQHKNQLPLYSRASDVRDLADCPGKWALSYLYSPELPEMGWFILGDAVHFTIEAAIIDKLSEEEALAEYQVRFVKRIMDAEGPIQWSSRRDQAQSKATGEAAISTWFKMTQGPDRDPILNGYEEYPQPEVLLSVSKGKFGEVPAYAIRTEADAIYPPAWGSIRESPLIVDWKTGSKAHAKSLQLHLYYYAGRKAGIIPDYASFHGAFFHLAQGKVQKADPYPGDDVIEAMIQYVEGMKGLMRDGKVLFRPDWWCNTCRAKSVCPIEGQGNLEEVQRKLKKAQWLQEPIDGHDIDTEE
jgi:hypothetical protein